MHGVGPLGASACLRRRRRGTFGSSRLVWDRLYPASGFERLDKLALAGQVPRNFSLILLTRHGPRRYFWRTIYISWPPVSCNAECHPALSRSIQAAHSHPELGREVNQRQARKECTQHSTYLQRDRTQYQGRSQAPYNTYSAHRRIQSYSLRNSLQNLSASLGWTCRQWRGCSLASCHSVWFLCFS